MNLFWEFGFSFGFKFNYNYNRGRKRRMDHGVMEINCSVRGKRVIVLDSNYDNDIIISTSLALSSVLLWDLASLSLSLTSSATRFAYFTRTSTVCFHSSKLFYFFFFFIELGRPRVRLLLNSTCGLRVSIALPSFEVVLFT